MIKVAKTAIEGVLIIEPQRFGDERGYFVESFSARDFRAATGLDVEFVQDNESLSRRGVLRGLHFQRGEWAQSKLVRVVRGRVMDVAVDIRRDSPTFGKYVAVELSGTNGRQLFIPKGFAHGFVTLENDTVFQYKCDAYYCPEAESGFAWDDSDVAIDWSIPREEIILSEKDRNRPKLCELCEY